MAESVPSVESVRHNTARIAEAAGATVQLMFKQYKRAEDLRAATVGRVMAFLDNARVLTNPDLLVVDPDPNLSTTDAEEGTKPSNAAWEILDKDGTFVTTVKLDEDRTAEIKYDTGLQILAQKAGGVSLTHDEAAEAGDHLPDRVAQLGVRAFAEPVEAMHSGATREYKPVAEIDLTVVDALTTPLSWPPVDPDKESYSAVQDRIAKFAVEERKMLGVMALYNEFSAGAEETVAAGSPIAA